MAGHGNLCLGLTKAGNIPDGAGLPVEWDVQHLIEIAIINLAVPTDGQQLCAHDVFCGLWVKIIEEQLHVVMHFAVALKHVCVAFDGHVGDGEQLVELNAEFILQMRMVVGFKRFLFRR